MSLTEGLEAVKKSIEEAKTASGRAGDDITLVAVSKTKPASDIEELYRAGHRDFGENYVQELMAKAESLPKDIRWHMIGHLQRNKVKYIAPFIYMIHSVDSYHLAETIDKEARKHGRVIPVLIEVNAGGEESKFGVTVDEAKELAVRMLDLPNISLRGFMTSAPFTDDENVLRSVFRCMRELVVDMNLKNNNNEKADVLSMGMSNDYLIAVEEGSTCVRVGSLIFGHRG